MITRLNTKRAPKFIICKRTTTFLIIFLILVEFHANISVHWTVPHVIYPPLTLPWGVVKRLIKRKCPSA